MRSDRKLTKLLVLMAVIVLCGGIVIAAAINEDDAAVIFQSKPMLASGLEALSNRHVHPFSENSVDSIFADTDGFTLAAQTGEAELWLNEERDTLRIRNKKTGYIWGTLPENAEGLNTTWVSYGNSIAAIECFDGEGIDRRYGMSENAEATYTITENGFICYADFTELGISFEVSVSLTGNKLNFAIAEDSIAEGMDDKEFTLKSVSFLPYLGSAYGDALDGYLFIPDGPGALIRFQMPSDYASTYDKKVYGRDLGIESLAIPSDLQAYRPNDYTVDEQQALLPVYGVVHSAMSHDATLRDIKQNGLFFVIEGGDEYASIAASPAIYSNPYNRVTARFEYRQKYNKNINRKEGAGIAVPQEHRNELSPSLSIYILDGPDAHYDGMAVLYRGILREAGVLNGLAASGTVPLRLEILGADKKRQFIGTSTQIFTTTRQAEDIIAMLADNAITDLSVVYRCYARNNEAGQPFLGGVGSSADFEALAEGVNARGGGFYLYLDPLSANEDQITLRTQAANNLSNMLIKLTRPNYSVMHPDTYFYRLQEADRLISKALGYGDFSFAVDQLSFRLYGDFTSGRETTRARNLQTSIDMMGRIARGKIPLYKPNLYMWRFASEFYDSPLVSSQFLYATDTVPFLQIVLSGSIDQFGIPLNTGTFSTVRLLRHIEYGVYPSFILSGCDSLDLYRTAQEDFFSTNYKDWEHHIVEAYDTVCGALAPIYDRSITQHTAVQDGFIRVTYDDGTRVYVNYTDGALTDGDVTVEGLSYAVIDNP